MAQQRRHFNVAHIPWRNGKGDVVREYVDAFRSRGLLPGLYYSIWDTTEGVAAGQMTTAKLEYVKTQLTELLTNYGPIPVLVMDGWSWQMGHNEIAYEEIRALVKSLQPDCLMTDHAHLADPWDVDIISFEEPRGGWSPAGNTYPGAQGQKMNASGGNDWFWAPDIGGLMTVAGHRRAAPAATWNRSGPTSCSTARPTATGLLDAAIVARLREVGAAWTPNAARPPLPAQGPQNERPYTPVSATATSGDANAAIDGKNDTDFISMWKPTGALPQSITLDLGRVQPDVGWLGSVPHYRKEKSSKDGNVTSYRILTSTDGSTFTEAATGTWAADGRMKAVAFAPRPPASSASKSSPPTAPPPSPKSPSARGARQARTARRRRPAPLAAALLP